MAFAAALTEKRGPRVGDAASLWNFTPAPGWTREEVQILRLCLMKHGVGQWLQILGTGLLPGKMIQQLNGQTQRLLGQQSLAAFTGLRVDVDRVRTDNEVRSEATRKAGLIIYDGPTLTKEMKAELREEAQRKYGLTPEQLQKVDEQLEEVAAAMRSAGLLLGDGGGVGVGAGGDGGGGGGGSGGGPLGLMDLEHVVARADPELAAFAGLPLEQLSPDQLVQLLKRLRNRLACLRDRQLARQGLPPREGPRWAPGESEAAALLRSLAEAEAEVEGGVGTSGRHLLAEATAGRVRNGPSGGPPRPPVAAGGQAGAARAKRGGKISRPRATSSGSGAYGDGQDWSAGEENAGPSGSRGGGGGGGAKRKAGGGGGAGVAPVGEGAGSRRVTRKRPAIRYDKYVDDGDYDEADPGGGDGRGRGGGGGCVDPGEALSQLTAMGFTPRKARGALQDCDFNVEAAVEWLVANCL